ncbi:hypothetical protein GS597_18420 [Synechococcales cyanobacterium C]|uniref:Histidine kinase n=2 Tax=Petrachloros TaxID=2918834 RepID=A0A8K2A099_9CYAN|nr:hypothetical protein [Petrachloros mirabilis ULC683]
MQWVSALSTRPSLEQAIDEVVQHTQSALQKSADLGLIFISNTFTSEYPRLLPLLQERLQVRHLIGCGGSGIIGPQMTGKTIEVEQDPALVLTLAHLPEVQIHAFHIAAESLPDPDSAPDAWINMIGVSPQAQPHFLLFADSGTAKIKDLLQGLDYAYTGSTKVGGLTGGTAFSVTSGLFCDGHRYESGTVGIALSGNIHIDTIVAQGCRPIGPLYRVTAAERHVLLQIEAQPVRTPGGTLEASQEQTPLSALQSVVNAMTPEDQVLAQKALSIGIARNEFQQTLEPGDFLIRNLIGVDPRNGAVAIGDRIRPGQRVQFHLRDAQSSQAELVALLQQYCDHQGEQSAFSGALLFDCLGRGEQFYQQPHVDSQLLHQHISGVPLSGFFCQGEIGPIGDTTFLHGYTAVFALIRSRN